MKYVPYSGSFFSALRVFFSVRAAGGQSSGEAASAKGKEKVGDDFDEDNEGADETKSGGDAEETFACPGCFDDSPNYTKLSCGHAFW
jgi:hypothetical protein